MSTVRPIEETHDAYTRTPQNGWSSGMEQKAADQNISAKEYALRGADTGTTFDSLEKPGIGAPAYFDEEGHDWNAPAETAQDLVDRGEVEADGGFGRGGCRLRETERRSDEREKRGGENVTHGNSLKAAIGRKEKDRTDERVSELASQQVSGFGCWRR